MIVHKRFFVLAYAICVRVAAVVKGSASQQQKRQMKVNVRSLDSPMPTVRYSELSDAFASLLLAVRPATSSAHGLQMHRGRSASSHRRFAPHGSAVQNSERLVADVRVDQNSVEELQREVLDVRSNALGVEHPETLMMKSDLAHTLGARADLEGAENLLRQVFEARVRMLGPAHPDTLASKSDLAQTLLARGKVSDAEKLQSEVLEAMNDIRQNKNVPVESALASSFESLRTTSEALQREVLRARNSTLGPDHPDTLASQYNLAQTLRANGHMLGAEELHREVMNGRMRALGVEHTDTLTSKSALASLLRARGDLIGAEDLQGDVLESRIRLLGPEHPETVKSKKKFALLSQDLGKLKGAEDLQRKVLEQMKREGGAVPACTTAPIPPAVLDFNKALVDTVKGAIDVLYRGRDIPRFYVLETIARVPYFAYLSVLHLYESLGMRGTTRRLRTHYAEADNELHHLLIMESLGGSDAFLDRFIAQHLALTYYWYNVAVYLFLPQAAYHLGELIEAHAFSTYNKFLEEHGDELRKRPVPRIAQEYYGGRDPFENYLNEDDERSRPALNSLYDVFVQIRNDEGEHWRTLCNLVQYGDLDEPDGCPVVDTESRQSDSA